MILYVVTDTYDQYRNGTGWYAHRNCLEELAEDACIVIHYKQLDMSIMERLRPLAVCHSGGGTDYADYDVLTTENYRRVVLEYASA